MLMPSFEQKMSLLVADCPGLAQKILAKDNGYFIPLGSFNIKKHPDVLLRIIDESREDYLYPKDLFTFIELPRETKLALAAAA